MSVRVLWPFCDQVVLSLLLNCMNTLYLPTSTVARPTAPITWGTPLPTHPASLPPLQLDLKLPEQFLESEIRGGEGESGGEENEPPACKLMKMLLGPFLGKAKSSGVYEKQDGEVGWAEGHSPPAFSASFHSRGGSPPSLPSWGHRTLAPSSFLFQGQW